MMKEVKRRIQRLQVGPQLGQANVGNHLGSEEQARSRALAQPLSPRCVHAWPSTRPRLLQVPCQFGAPSSLSTGSHHCPSLQQRTGAGVAHLQGRGAG